MRVVEKGKEKEAHDPVKLAPLISLRTAQWALRLAGTELAEVLCCSGDDIGEELEGDASKWLSYIFHQYY